MFFIKNFIKKFFWFQHVTINNLSGTCVVRFQGLIAVLRLQKMDVVLFLFFGFWFVFVFFLFFCVFGFMQSCLILNSIVQVGKDLKLLVLLPWPHQGQDYRLFSTQCMQYMLCWGIKPRAGASYYAGYFSLLGDELDIYRGVVVSPSLTRTFHY